MQYRFSALAAYIPLLCSGIWQASAQHSADAAPVPPEIKAIFDGPRYKDAICGLRVIDLETGQMLINLEPRHKFFIGSVRKIFSVGELLNQIGPTHTFNTPMYRQGTISETGTLHGNLILVASGDLTMGGRTNPDGTVAFSNFDHNEADSLGNAELTGPDSLAGDALEDLGFSRPEILHQMRLLPLTGQFRQSWQYSNFGFTEGAIAPSKRVQEPWEDLARKRLFKPLGMTDTSYRYSDYRNAANKAAIHTIIDGKAVARYHRDPDAEAPAGSASSSVRDLAEWLRLQLAGGRRDGQSIVATDALKETHSPQIQRGTDRTGNPLYYGLGWNIDHDAAGKVLLGHSGAFFLGTGTTVKFSPSQQLGIVVLTNALPTGLAEATANTFFDLYNFGAPTEDWLTIFGSFFKADIENGNNSTTDYSKLTPPSSPVPGKALSAYVGTYRNEYYGQIEISEQHGSLWMRFPDTGALYTLSHWNADTFTYRFEAEQAIGTRGVVFTTSGTPSVLVENLALEGNGVFQRIDGDPR